MEENDFSIPIIWLNPLEFSRKALKMKIHSEIKFESKHSWDMLKVTYCSWKYNYAVVSSSYTTSTHFHRNSNNKLDVFLSSFASLICIIESNISDCLFRTCLIPLSVTDFSHRFLGQINLLACHMYVAFPFFIYFAVPFLSFTYNVVEHNHIWFGTVRRTKKLGVPKRNGM